MKTLILVETKKEYKQARDEISKSLESKGIAHTVNDQDRSIVGEGKSRIDFVIKSDKKSEVPQGAKYNKVVTWSKK